MPLISSRSFKCLGQSVCLSSKNGPADTVTERFINWRLDVKTASQITQPSTNLILICCAIYDVVFIRSGVRKLTPGCFCKAFAGTSTESGLMAPNRSDKGWTNWSKVCNTCAVYLVSTVCRHFNHIERWRNVTYTLFFITDVTSHSKVVA